MRHMKAATRRRLTQQRDHDIKAGTTLLNAAIESLSAAELAEHTLALDAGSDPKCGKSWEIHAVVHYLQEVRRRLYKSFPPEELA